MTIEECQLRDKNWVELIPRMPDVDAIAENFFESKGKSKVKTFVSKKGIEIYLSIEYEKYDAVLDHLAEQVRLSCMDHFVYLIALQDYQVSELPSTRRQGVTVSQRNDMSARKRRLSTLSNSNDAVCLVQSSMIYFHFFF